MYLIFDIIFEFALRSSPLELFEGLALLIVLRLLTEYFSSAITKLLMAHEILLNEQTAQNAAEPDGHVRKGCIGPCMFSDLFRD